MLLKSLCFTISTKSLTYQRGKDSQTKGSTVEGLPRPEKTNNLGGFLPKIYSKRKVDTIVMSTIIKHIET